MIMTPQEYLDWCKDMSERLKKYEYHFTNADRIRSMTDDELVEFLYWDADGSGKSQEQWLRWLKEEV